MAIRWSAHRSASSAWCRFGWVHCTWPINWSLVLFTITKTDVTCRIQTHREEKVQRSAWARYGNVRPSVSLSLKYEPLFGTQKAKLRSVFVAGVCLLERGTRVCIGQRYADWICCERLMRKIGNVNTKRTCNHDYRFMDISTVGDFITRRGQTGVR